MLLQELYITKWVNLPCAQYSRASVDLLEDKDGILGTDSESEISEDNDHSFINHDADWVSVFGNGKSLNCVFLAIFNWLFLLL